MGIRESNLKKNVFSHSNECQLSFHLIAGIPVKLDIIPLYYLLLELFFHLQKQRFTWLAFLDKSIATFSSDGSIFRL